jgi:nifR3 family TIM-barrel protein
MLAAPLQLGPVALDTNLLLAPIAGWCDLAWRMTVRRLGGVGLACTDLLSPQGLLCGSEASADLARTNDLDKPIGMQLYGSDPALLADAARWCVDHGATVLDINMGCPVDKVCKKDGGSRLMCIPDTAQRIVERVRTALPDHVPLTAKMRLGWTEQDAAANAAGDLACRLIAAGVCGITVHGRTTEQRFKGQCRRQGIRRVVEAVGEKFGACDGSPTSGPPVIGNGDVRTPADAVSMIEETGCAGVMIGRGAFAIPWIFAEAWALQLQRVPWLRSAATMTETPRHAQVMVAEDSNHGTRPYTPPSEPEKLDIIRQWFDLMRDFRDDRYAMYRVRQKISWLGKSINGSHCRPLKDAVRTATTPAHVHAAIDAWEREMPVCSCNGVAVG